MVQFEVTIKLPLHSYQTLKKIAALSGGDMGSAVSSLVKYWETNEATAPPPIEQPDSIHQLWRSPRGDMFPVGLELQADYLGKQYTAKVTTKGIEYNGQLFHSPSAAAIAVKQSAGKAGSAASTNGWSFWQMYDPKLKLWLPISSLKAKK